MAVLAALLVLVSAATYAQAPTGTITGLVTDSTGAVVAGARLTLTNLQTGQTRVLTTSAEGMYTAAALLPGAYRLTIDVTGFVRIDRGASVEAGTTTSVDISLQLESVTANVTVRG